MGRSLIVLMLLVPTLVLAETVTITASQDNTIFNDGTGTNSNGAGNHIFAGRTNQGNIRRALVAFKDLSAIPGDATIESVKLILHLNKETSEPTTIRLHRLTTDWGEGTSNAPTTEGQGTAPSQDDATWMHKFYNNSTWSSQGGDFASSASGQLPVDAFGSYTVGSTSTLVSDVQGWLDNPGSNFGWIILADESGRSARRFGSRDQVVESNRPRIEVEYSGGTGGGGGFTIDPGIGGNWWNGPARDGEGAQVEVADDGNGGLIFIATIYSYDPSGNQIFMIAVGSVDGDTATVDLFITEGGVWGEDLDPDLVTESQWGTGTFTASSCDLLHMDLQPNAQFQALGYTNLAYDLVPLTTRAIACPASGGN